MFGASLFCVSESIGFLQFGFGLMERRKRSNDMSWWEALGNSLDANPVRALDRLC